MKHILFILCIFFAAIAANAQEHLSFKGIPIEGSITTFCQKLKAKGFVQRGSENNIRFFKGDFTGRTATVGVVAADNGQIFTVAVFFDKTDSWNTLVNTYDHYKDLYIEKYGQPTICVEDNPSRSDSNTSLMYDNKLISTQHNILFENNDYCIVARHDDVESEDYDAMVEIGVFKLNDKSYNARFSDIYGRMNYTNIKV